MATIVNERYALALYEVAQDQKKVPEMLEQLTAVADICRGTPEFLKMLSTPSIPLEDKKETIRTAFEGKIDENLLNFLMLITDKRRVSGLLEMQEAFKKRYYDEQGICEVTAVTAIAMTDALAEKLRAKVETITGKKVIMHTKTDAAILGGVVLKIGNEQIDTSVRTQLAELAQQMTQIIA